jgi:hypothetical protein
MYLLQEKNGVLWIKAYQLHSTYAITYCPVALQMHTSRKERWIKK